MKNHMKSVFFEVINSSATSVCSINKDNFTLQCLHQGTSGEKVRVKQNSFNRFHILL